jgi:hypothetical protein
MGWALLAVGDTLAPAMPTIGNVTQLGALGVLTWVAYTQREEIQKLRAEHKTVIDTLCARWDEWEKIRHEDSDKLDGTLRRMTRRCAVTQTRLRATKDESAEPPRSRGEKTG